MATPEQRWKDLTVRLDPNAVTLLDRLIAQKQAEQPGLKLSYRTMVTMLIYGAADEAGLLPAASPAKKGAK